MLELDASGKPLWAHVVSQTWGDSARLWLERSSPSGVKLALEAGAGEMASDTKRFFGLCTPQPNGVRFWCRPYGHQCL